MNENKGWQLCGDGPEAYEKYIVPAFSGAWARDIVKRAGLQKGDRILNSISNYVDDHGLAAPMECYVVTARK